MLDLALPLLLFVQDIPVVNIVEFVSFGREQIFELAPQKVVVRLFVKFEIPAVFHEINKLDWNRFLNAIIVSGMGEPLVTRLDIIDFHFNELLYRGIHFHILDDGVFFCPGLGFDSLPREASFNEVDQNEA